MSDAIEGADVMLYGVSLRYKESVNVSRTAVLGVCMVAIMCGVSERLADSLHLCCCPGSVEWCVSRAAALDVKPDLDLPNCPTNCPMSAIPNSHPAVILCPAVIRRAHPRISPVCS